jgi:hypothetical protein
LLLGAPHRAIVVGILEGRRVKFRGKKLEDRDREIVFSRNKAAHKPNILAEIDCIQNLDENKFQHISAYKTDFKRCYGIHFEKVIGKLRPSQTEVIQAFNSLCADRDPTVRKRLKRKDRKAITAKVDEIVKALITSKNSDEFEHRLEQDKKSAELPTTAKVSTTAKPSKSKTVRTSKK